MGRDQWAGAVGRCPYRPQCPHAHHRSASTPETWAKFTQENLCRAERERLASANLRGLIDCILRDTSEDLRLQCDAVNLAFGNRCEELEDARHKLEHHLRKVCRRAKATPSHACPAQATPTSCPGHAPASPWGWAPSATERDRVSCGPALARHGHQAWVMTRPCSCSSSAPPIRRDPRGPH